MILSKIMQNSLDDAENLIKGRYGEIYQDSNKYSLFIQEVRKAYEKKSLVELSSLLKENEVLI